MYSIIHTLLGVYGFCKFQIQPDFYYYYTDVEIIYLYKAFNNSKYVQCYIESLGFPTGSPTVHWEDNIGYISVFGAKRITPRVKHINILVFSTGSIIKWFIYS